MARISDKFLKILLRSYPRPTVWHKTIAYPVFVEAKHDDYAADAH
jgi:hypothetical protein